MLKEEDGGSESQENEILFSQKIFDFPGHVQYITFLTDPV